MVLNNQQQQIQTFQALIKVSDDLQQDEGFDSYGSHVTYALDHVKQKYNQPQRHQDISVVIVDYDMPEMDGLTFCEELQGLPIKKIMLTGEAENQVAIDAFNKGVIDGFINKSAGNLHQELVKLIRQQQQKYLGTLQKSIIDAICLHLNDANILEEYNQLVEHFVTQHNITEYYMTDSKGSYLLLDKTGHEYFLQIYSPDELTMYHDIAANSEVTTEMLTNLAYRHQAPLFGHEDKNYVLVDQWHSYMNEITAFSSDSGFFYGIKI